VQDEMEEAQKLREAHRKAQEAQAAKEQQEAHRRKQKKANDGEGSGAAGLACAPLGMLVDLDHVCCTEGCASAVSAFLCWKSVCVGVPLDHR